MKKRFSDEQIVGFLREVESGEKSVAQVCREGGFSQPTFYVWKKKFGAMGDAEEILPVTNGETTIAFSNVSGDGERGAIQLVDKEIWKETGTGTVFSHVSSTRQY